MPLILSALGVFLAASIPGIVARVLLALGMGFVFFSGFNLLLANLFTEIQALFTQTGPLVALFARLGVDKALSVIFSAYSVAWSVRAAMGWGRRLVPVGG